MDDVTWGALTLTLTLIGGIYTWFAYRRRGLAAGLRGAGFTLLPLALLLTDTLRMVTRIADAVDDWALHLAWSPVVWSGLLLGGVSVALFFLAGFLTKREIGTTPRERPAEPDRAALPQGHTQGRGTRSAPVVSDPVDAEMAEIEALLRKRGIT